MQDQAAALEVKKKPSDFVFGKVIGEGSFSTVSFLYLLYVTGRQNLPLFIKTARYFTGQCIK